MMLKNRKTEMFRRELETISSIAYSKKRISRMEKITIAKMKNSIDECYQTDKMGASQYSGRQIRINYSEKKIQRDKRMKNTNEMVKRERVQDQVIVLYNVRMYKTN